MSAPVTIDRPDDTLISETAPPASQALSGLLLLACALVALLWANSRWADAYHAFTHLPIAGTTLGHAINDGLMAIFFLLVGLEIKHELQDGALSTVRRATLPVVGAIGGMVLPAFIYLAVARGTDAAPGWGIPMATDIAFALGIVALLGVLFLLNARHVHQVWPYGLLGVALWWAVYASGVHASIAGVLLAFTVPARGSDCVQSRIEHALHTPVSYGIVPLFALANAGVTLPPDVVQFTQQPAVLATTLGLVIGKPLGIFSAAWLAVRLRLADLPQDSDWQRVLGVATLGGIGFTMSLFIAGLAFGEGAQLDAAKIGVLAGSLLTGIGGALLLARQARAGVATLEPTLAR